MKKIYEFLGGRKMTFALMLFVIATIILWAGKSDFSGWNICFRKWNRTYVTTYGSF